MPPIKNDPAAVQAQIQHALRNDILSSREANRLIRHIKQDGVTEAEVKMVVDTLKAAMAGSADSLNIDLSTNGRKKNLNRLLGTLHQEQPLPLPGVDASTAPESVNWLTLMTQQSNVVDTALLPEDTFGGREIGIGSDGSITLDDQVIDLSGTPDADMQEALWALNQPGQLMSLDPATREALQTQLFDLAAQHVGVANDAQGKCQKLIATTAAIGALAGDADEWTPEMADQALALAEKVPNPMAKAILLRGLGNANLSPEQQTKLQSFEQPENHELLLKAYDDTRNEFVRLGYNANVKGEAAQFLLSGLTFAKKQTSIDNLHDGMKAWKDLNSGSGWDSEEISNMNRILDTYVDKYPQTAYVYGTFSKEAPKRIAEITSARAVEALTPSLQGPNPSIDGFPLTREQADYIQTILPNLEDKDAAKGLVKSLAMADGIFQSRFPSSYSTPTPPNEPMKPAAFELFKSFASGYQETAGSTKTGKLDYSSFTRDFGDHARTIHNALKPQLTSLNATPPKWGDTTLSTEAANFVKSQLFDHTRSVMSVDNIGRAIDIFSAKHGGKLEGAAFEQFQEMVTDYKANWPDLKTFDFNKLERIASFKVEGRELPLCTINGQQVGLAEFYNKVGMDVAGAIDGTNQRHEWMADRWGYRAKQSVELLDVVAEQTARDEGPIAALKERYPNAEIEIQATGQDGAHEQFLYVVKDGRRTIGTFAQGSDGQMGRANSNARPVLFTATVNEDGALDVNIPQRIAPRRFPLQTTYAVGDKIDIEYRDYSVQEAQEEGEEFVTRSKVLEAEIKSYDAKGNYTVEFTNPKGEKETKTLSMRSIRRANNPHYFKPKASYFSDVNIDIDTDAALKTFLEEAQPIIDRYLPADGSTINMDPQELAKRQKECIEALMDYTSERVKYPASKDGRPDEASQKYHEFVDGYGRFPLGELVKIGKGVCRHQCILEHLLLQQAGIESRLASGAANTSSGNFRGYHIWTEVTLADNERYLSDQTWDDATIPLWEGAYGTDKRRTEMYFRTARYDNFIEE